MTKKAELVLVVFIVSLCAFGVYAGLVAGDRKDQIDDLKQQLTVQNVQLTKQMRGERAKAYRMGIIACGNEDVEWLNQQADEYQRLAGNNPLSKLLREWAQTWAYDDDTLNQMVEQYMNGDTN